MAVQPKKITGGAFGRYLAENRVQLLKDTAGKPATASIKLASERWKALGAPAKVKFEKMYADAKQQYEKDLAAFLEAGGEMKANKSKKSKKDKKVKDPNKPKRPAGGAYGCYMTKNRKEIMKECAGKPITAVSKIAGVRWKALSPTEKQPFEKEYQTKKAAYLEAMKDYVPPAAATNDDEDGSDKDGDDEESEEEGEEVDEEEAEEKAPKKRAAGGKADAPAAKKGKTGPSQDDVEAEAKKLGYLAKLKTLAANPQVKSTPSKILDMLQQQNGSVIAAKKALIGGA